MWPWEHAIVAYLTYSLFCHVMYRNSPGGLEVLAVVFASVLPDLIDKPLAWEYGVFESGYALGHSIFFAVPLSIIIGLLARQLSRPRTGVAFGLGYVLHPFSDVLDSYVRDDVVQFELLLWPIEIIHGHGQSGGFMPYFIQLFDSYRTALLAGALSTYLWVQVSLGLAVVVLWLYDGAPVLRECIFGTKNLIGNMLDWLLEPPEEPTDSR